MNDVKLPILKPGELVRFFNDQRPHCGVLIIPYTLPGDQFSRIAILIKRFSSRHPKGLTSYSIAFSPEK